MRSFLFIILALATLSGGVLFHVKYEVMNLESELASVQKNIRSTKENIDLLKTEWTELATPSRIQKLASDHLQLEPVKPNQVVALEKTEQTSDSPQGPICRTVDFKDSD